MEMPIDFARGISDAREMLDHRCSTARFKERRQKLEQLLEFDPIRGAERLDRLLAIARDRVPYYRALQGRESLRLSDFPLTRKADLRDHFADLISRKANGEMEPGRHFINQTSGSTGQPVRTLTTVETGGMANAVIHERINRYLELPERGTTLSVGLMFEGTRLFEAMPLPRPYVRCNLGGFDPASARIVAEYEATVGRFPVDKITGTSSRIIALAQYCGERAIRLRPRGIIATYEHMPESGRRLVEETFDCPVTMLYMTSETGYSAWECRRGNMHFQDDLVMPEVMPTGAEGKEVVLTALLSPAMPVIRYVTGDMAADTVSCDCGLPGTAISRLTGRARTSLIGVDGAVYSPYSLLAALAAAGIPDFQIIQDEPGILDLVIPFRSDETDAVTRDINSRLSASFGRRQGFLLRLRPSGHFVLTAMGKRNPVIQRLPVPLGPERTRYLAS
ncbi:hypothetical protein AB0D10_40390 [Kitasatospora sp. NPDC048545]|uniref:phenylacetate--CoA ligase family protein n=1 Tax=Kitasatospora sp. NPDC048545 TaxID=3157208 RepID=UPI00340E0C98